MTQSVYDDIRPMVEARYNDILERIKDARMFGLPIDLTDPKAVAVCAYFLGQTVQLQMLGVKTKGAGE